MHIPLYKTDIPSLKAVQEAYRINLMLVQLNTYTNAQYISLPKPDKRNIGTSTNSFRSGIPGIP